MNANKFFGSRFIASCGSVYALCAVLAGPALAQTPPAEDGKVKMSDYNTFDISVQDTDLAVVLQMLSIESKKNIMASNKVSATVTANLHDVTFDEALKAILEVNGLTYYQEGNFIYVITKEEHEAMEKAKLKTSSKIFELDYLSAADATEFIQPLLSADGKASARGGVQPGMKPDLSNAGADDYAFTPRLVVNDYPDNLEAITSLLGELDVPPLQVLVESTILQTSLDEANAFGVDFSVVGSMNFTDLTNPLAAVSDLLGGSSSTGGFQPADNEAHGVSTSVGDTRGPGGLKVGYISDEVSVFLRVLDEVTDSTVLARPKVMALNRQRAQVLVGARVGYLSTTATETSTTQTVEFLDTGIQLVFRPFISKDGMVRMELSPSVSEASLRSVTQANGQVVTIPDELTNEMTTNVRIKDGQTLVLGGLFRESTNITRRQVPWLGDIPLVGAAFRGQDDAVQRTEIIFLITPNILQDETLWARGQEVIDSVDALRVGARAGLLLFSQEKVTSNYNQKAQDAIDAGDHDRALYYINNSLRMHANQPEMIRLREEVTAEKARSHERSLMQRVFHRHVAAASANSNEMSTYPFENVTSTDSMNPFSTNADMHNTTFVHPDSQWVDLSKNTSTTTTETSTYTDTAWDDTTVETIEQVSDASTDSIEGSSDTVSNTVENTESTVSGDPDDVWESPDASSSSQAHSEFLHEFFFALGLLDLADRYACYDHTVNSSFPFATFDSVTLSSAAGYFNP